MPLNLPLLRRGVHRLIAGKPADIRSFSVNEQILCAQETTSTQPAIWLDGELDLVRDLSPWREWSIEQQLMQGGDVTHDPTLALEIKSVDICGAFLYTKAAKAQIGFGSEQIWPTHEKSETIQQATVRTTLSGSYFFGHLLYDEFTLALLEGNEGKDIALSSNTYGHGEPYRELLGVPKFKEVSRAFVEKLTLFVDYSQNSLKKQRYQLLRENIRRHLGPQPTHTGIYIRRGSQGSERLLINEIQVEKLLTTLGFRIVDPDVNSAVEIATISLEANIVISIEGSQLCHGFFTAAEKASFIVLQPPDRFAMAFKEFTNRMDMDFAFIVGMPAENGFTIDVDRLMYLLDLVETRRSTRNV